MTEKIYDLTIIGGGPVGIYGAFYAGMHGMTTKIIDADSAYIMNDMLNNVVKEGTAKKLSFTNFDIYAKTGTVGDKNGNTDAYCISYTGDYVLGVWVGVNNKSYFPNNSL